MFKKVLGKTFSYLGYPFGYFVLSAYSQLQDERPIRFLISTMGAVFTLPLAPAMFYGEHVLMKCREEEFLKKNKGLPRVSRLSDNYARIEEDEGVFFIEPQYTLDIDGYNEEFSSKDEARSFLLTEGYKEVVYFPHYGINKVDMSSTYWIKE